MVQDFIKSKSNSFVSLLSDQDLKTYFEKNRLKFGSVSFEQVKDSIRNFMNSQEKEERLKTWIDVLKKKYKVRNYLNEGKTVVTPQNQSRESSPAPVPQKK